MLKTLGTTIRTLARKNPVSRGSAVAARGEAHPEPYRLRHTARALAHAIDEATRSMQFGLANRLADAAGRMPLDIRRASGLCERLARLRAVQGDCETALSIVDSAGQQTSSMRLLRTACLIQLGRRDEAHLELQQWSSRTSAPVNARAMLALLEWHAGDVTAACDALRLNLRQFEDPRTLALLMLLHAAAGRSEQAERWADRLRQACAFSGEAQQYNRILESLGCEPAQADSVSANDTHVETLALELIAGESAIPALVAGQHVRLQPPIARLLCAAIEQALPDLSDRAAAILAIIELNELLGECDAARAWAMRGVEECPMSVTLARRVTELKPMPIVAHESAIDEAPLEHAA